MDGWLRGPVVMKEVKFEYWVLSNELLYMTGSYGVCVCREFLVEMSRYGTCGVGRWVKERKMGGERGRERY